MQKKGTDIIMILTVCVDDNMGTAFNNRRQSRDRGVLRDIVKNKGDARLLTGSYSAPLFKGICDDITASDDHLSIAEKGDICFCERETLEGFEERAEKVILYRWNRNYPYDTRLLLDLEKYELLSIEEFCGTSHERISKETYKLSKQEEEGTKR